MMSTRDAVSSLLQACLETDNNVFNESRGRPVLSRPPLQQSLSLPLDRYYQSDHPGAGTGDAAFPPARLPAPRSVERRTQSIGDSSTAQYQILGADVAGMTSRQATAAAAPTRYKTELCRPYEENGSCRYGSKCQFAHGKAELRSVVRHPKYKTDLCRTYHTTGLCPYGPRCHFIHNDDERRTTTADCSAAEQLHRQLAAAEEIGRRSTSIQRGLDDRPRLQRQYSEYRPRPDASQASGGVPAAPGNPRGAGNSGTALQRRASAVADAVIRRSVGYQRHLQTVAEVDPLNVRIAAAKSLSSAAESFSSGSSSVTDSPSPSPTAGLHPAAAVDDSPPVRPPVAGWTPDCETARTALLAELVSRLGPQDIAAALIRALQLPGSAAATAGSPLPRDLDLGREAELSSMRQLHPDIWTQYLQQQQQQQQRAPATSNVCW